MGGAFGVSSVAAIPCQNAIPQLESAAAGVGNTTREESCTGGI